MRHFTFMIGLLAISTATVSAAEGSDPISFNGSIETGYAATWRATTLTNDSQWLIDQARMSVNVKLSEATRVVIENSLAVTPVATSQITGALAPLFSSASYFSGASLKAGSLTFSNTAAFIDHKIADDAHFWVGNFVTPFGMESMASRWDMASYYYSAAYANTNDVNGLGWMYDVGVKFVIDNVAKGILEMSLMDGRSLDNTDHTPALAFRYHREIKAGDLSFTPVASAYFGRFIGAPKDVGFTIGGEFKKGKMFANAEWVYTSTNQLGVKSILWSAYVEPGVDLSFFTISAKADLVSDSNNTDFNLGAAISHEFNEAIRLKIAYEQTGFGGKVIAGNLPHVNDLRLLVGMQF